MGEGRIKGPHFGRRRLPVKADQRTGNPPSWAAWVFIRPSLLFPHSYGPFPSETFKIPLILGYSSRSQAV